MNEPLLPFWSTWRKARAAELARAGFPKSLSKAIALREAMNRQFLTKIIGRSAALKADLITSLRADGTFSVHAAVKESSVPLPLRQRADGWAAMNGFSTATPQH